MPIWDKLKTELDRAGKAAQTALDEGKMRLEAFRVRQLADKAAQALGYAVYRATQGRQGARRRNVRSAEQRSRTTKPRSRGSRRNSARRRRRRRKPSRPPSRLTPSIPGSESQNDKQADRGFCSLPDAFTNLAGA